MFDKDGKVRYEAMKYNLNELFEFPPNFDAPVIDFDRVRVSKDDDPMGNFLKENCKKPYTPTRTKSTEVSRKRLINKIANSKDPNRI